MIPIKVTQIFDSSLEKVWKAISDENELKQWYFQVEHYCFEVNKTFSFYENVNGMENLYQCEFLAIIPQKIVTYILRSPGHFGGSSILRWALFPEGAKTRLELTHTEVETALGASSFGMNWEVIVKIMLRNYLYGIKRLKFEVNINATREKIWDKLWRKENYTTWTSSFGEDSYYEGELSQGNRVYLLSASGDGMYSDIAFYKMNEWVVFKHIGVLKDRKELPIDVETEKWTGCLESYKLERGTNSVVLIVEVDTAETYLESMNKVFTQALLELKIISEN